MTEISVKRAEANARVRWGVLPVHGINERCRDGVYGVMIAGGFVGVAQGGEGNSVVAATWLIELRIL